MSALRGLLSQPLRTEVSYLRVGIVLAALVAVGACCATPAGARVIWRADMETGDLSQWNRGRSSNPGQAVDTGDCRRPPGGVSDEVAHRGRFSMKMTIDTSEGLASCRQFRYEELRSGRSYYYSAWFYFTAFHDVADFWNLVQLKSENGLGMKQPFWVLDVVPRTNRKVLHVRLRWKGQSRGPHFSDEKPAKKFYLQNLKNVPIRRWFNVEIYLRQSGRFAGRLIVWQDGARIYDLVNVRTHLPNGDQRISVNNYSNGLDPPESTLFIDDVVISTTRVYALRSRQVSPATVPGGQGAGPAPSSGQKPAGSQPAAASGERSAGLPQLAAGNGGPARQRVVIIAVAIGVLAAILLSALLPLPARLRDHRGEIVGAAGVAACAALLIAVLGG